MIAQATTRSLPAIARHAEQHIRQHGPMLAADAITELASHPIDRDRVEAGVRLAVVCGRLMLDRGGVLRIPGVHADTFWPTGHKVVSARRPEPPSGRNQRLNP